ncbi:MAG: NAD(P)H-hydrate epimerase [Thermomicrobiales bacterium]
MAATDLFARATWPGGGSMCVVGWSSLPTSYRGLAAHNLHVCQKLGMPIAGPADRIDLSDVDLVIDGLFGFGLSAAPSGRAADLIAAANRSRARVLAIDMPSGVDATTGVAFPSSIVADVTLTLGLPKVGLLVENGPIHAGSVVVADIGIPAAAYAAPGFP